MRKINPTPVLNSFEHVIPICPLFGQCGGCQYQDLSYPAELQIKESQLQKVFSEELDVSSEIFHPIIASPKEYHYRHRLDLKLLKTKSHGILLGFTPSEHHRGVIPTQQCFIAMEAVAGFLANLREDVIKMLPPRYRNANIVVRTGDDGRVFWGGVGKRSLQMKPEDYFWSNVAGKKIFYSMDTFFQANLSILPKVIEAIRNLKILDPQTRFYDLYGGVGLFGICFYDDVHDVTLVEENMYSTRLAEYNVQYHQLQNFKIISSRIEDHFTKWEFNQLTGKHVAMIDPPRGGLSESVRTLLAEKEIFENLLYLSCSVETLVRDLKVLTQGQWQIQTVVPFDFFPKTKHLETLVVLGRR